MCRYIIKVENDEQSDSDVMYTIYYNQEKHVNVNRQ